MSFQRHFHLPSTPLLLPLAQESNTNNANRPATKLNRQLQAAEDGFEQNPNTTSITSTPDVFGKQFHIPLPLPPRKEPPPRTPQGLLTCHIPGFRPKEARRAPWAGKHNDNIVACGDVGEGSAGGDGAQSGGAAESGKGGKEERGPGRRPPQVLAWLRTAGH